MTDISKTISILKRCLCLAVIFWRWIRLKVNSFLCMHACMHDRVLIRYSPPVASRWCTSTGHFTRPPGRLRPPPLFDILWATQTQAAWRCRCHQRKTSVCGSFQDYVPRGEETERSMCQEEVCLCHFFFLFVYKYTYGPHLRTPVWFNYCGKGWAFNYCASKLWSLAHFYSVNSRERRETPTHSLTSTHLLTHTHTLSCQFLFLFFLFDIQPISPRDAAVIDR